MKTVLYPIPPKNTFQFLCAIDAIEEFTKWKVTFEDDGFGEGFTWTEKRGFKKRTWTITAYDRRKLTFTQETDGVKVTFAAKKGGAGSCNAQMQVTGPKADSFLKTDGDRLDSLKAYLESD